MAAITLSSALRKRYKPIRHPKEKKKKYISLNLRNSSLSRLGYKISDTTSPNIRRWYAGHGTHWPDVPKQCLDKGSD